MRITPADRLIFCSLALALGLSSQVRADDTTVRHVQKPDAGVYAYAVGNKAPLTPSPFRKLPIGWIYPNGWVKKQLQLEAEGFTGRLTEISPWLNKTDNAWLSRNGAGKNGWEEVPYWLKGFGDLGYVLRDRRISQEAIFWVENVLSSERPNGYFGPESNLTANNGKPDVWPNMVMLFALQSYYEVSQDRRVLDMMTHYFKWELTIPDKDFLLSYWEPQRVGDNIASIFWLYNRTGDKSLFDLVDKLHRGGAKWSKGVANWHGVNMAQAFREPAELSQLNHDKSLIDATERDYQTMRRMYGQVPGGGYGADENARRGFSDPRQATETCTMVELMLSDEMLLNITGDPIWAERCEDIAFNSLPASMTPDLKSLHYLTSPNMILIDKASKSPGLENGGPMLLFNAYDHRCCQHNTSHGWPYYAEHLWLGAANNGLAAVMYAPCIVTAKVGSGTNVTINEKTTYPFDERVSFKIGTSRSVAFPLTLRWPSWCDRPNLKVNGKPLKLSGTPGGYIIVNRTWRNHDEVELTLPMKVQTHPRYNGSISVERGPLSYSLKIGEKYVRMGGTDKFPSFEVHPTTPWNYGLVTSNQDFKVSKKALAPDSQPFTPANAPISITAKAQKIDNWKMDHLGLVGLLQAMPAKSSRPIETVTLIPMGATRLRIADFPTVSSSPTAHAWKGPHVLKTPIPASASHVFGGDSVNALSQGFQPVNSNDQSIPRFTWWDHKGTTEWVEYNFPVAKTLRQAKVYWFDDRSSGGGCRVPKSWKLMYKDGDHWSEVKTKGQYGVNLDAFNAIDFTPVKSKSFRIEAQLKPNYSSGILSWEVK